MVSENGPIRQEVMGGSVILEADGTLVWQTLYCYSDRGSSSESYSAGRGTYSLQATNIIFSFDGDASRGEGTLEKPEGRRLFCRGGYCVASPPDK